MIELFNSDELQVLPLAQPRLKKNLILTNAAGLFRKNPSWEQIENVVCALQSYGCNIFCCLAAEDDSSYIQALCCAHDEYRLEQRTYMGSIFYVHSYAYPASAELSRIEEDERNGSSQCALPKLDSVLASFAAYFRSQAMPSGLNWRQLDI